MPLLRIAQVVFALLFLVAVGGFLHFLAEWKQVRDEEVQEWSIPGSLEVELQAGRHHLWLLQNPSGEERDKSFQEFWSEGWQLRANYLDESGEPTQERVLVNPANGHELWPESEQERVQVGFFTLERSGRIRLNARSVREDIAISEGQILLSKSSIAKQHRLSFWMLLWLVGGILLAVLSFFLISSFLPRSLLRGKQEELSAAPSNPS